MFYTIFFEKANQHPICELARCCIIIMSLCCNIDFFLSTESNGRQTTREGLLKTEKESQGNMITLII